MARIQPRYWVAGLLFLASALNFFDRQVLSVLAPTITAELGMSNADYSYVTAAFTLSYSVMFLVGGRLIDSLGTRAGMGLAVGFWSLASLLHAVVTGPLQLGALRFLLGVGEGGGFPGAAKGVAEWFPARERALGMGIATTAGSALGAVAAPPLIVWTALEIGWRGAFVVTGVLGAAWTTAWFVLFRRIGAAGPPEPTGGPARSADRVLRNRSLWRLAAARFCFDPVFYFYMFWIPQYLSQRHGASLETIGRLTWIPFLMLGLSSILAGFLASGLMRRGWSLADTRRRVMVGAALLTPVSILSIFGGDALSAILLLSVLLFAHGLWMTNFMALCGDLFPSRHVATAVGLTGTIGGLGGVLFNLSAGQTIDTFGYTPAIVFCGLAYLVALALLLPALRQVPQEAEA